jgi:predicted dehydrogenase
MQAIARQTQHAGQVTLTNSSGYTLNIADIQTTGDFNQAIRENREPRVSGEEGMKTSVLLEAAYHAAREGRVVRFATSTRTSG